MSKLAVAAAIAGVIGCVLVAGVGVLAYQGSRKPPMNGEYVALGSSFAAGAGLGSRAPGSPIVCQRSINGYPQQLARMTGLRLVDMTCSGATMTNVLHGGQMFQGPQIDALGAATKVVTLTAGGNDVGYVGDLTGAAFSRAGGLKGLAARLFWRGPKGFQTRDFGGLEQIFDSTLREIKRRAPNAHIIVVTYPNILPPSSTCPSLGITDAEANMMRGVANALAEVTRSAVRKAGVQMVDMSTLSIGHDACSAEPWVNGAAPERGAPFHPNSSGAHVAAQAIRDLLN